MVNLMVDQAFAVVVRTSKDQPDMTPPAKVAYYIGCMALICPFWSGFTLGGVLGDRRSRRPSVSISLCLSASSR